MTSEIAASLDLNLLRVFDAVHQTGSITEASKKLGITQSSTSHSLNRLRVFFGDPLFVFVSRKRTMEPTSRAIELAKPILEALTLIKGTVERHRIFDPLTSTRTFNVAMTDIGQTMYLPKLMTHFAAHAPRVNLAIHQLTRDTTRERLESGTIDLAIGPIDGLDVGCYQQRLYDSSWVCAVRSEHPRVKDVLTKEMFFAESHLVVAPPGTVHGGSLSTALYKTKETTRVALRVPDFHVAAQILSITDLIAAVPMGFIEVESASETLRSVPLPFDIAQQLVVRQFWHVKFHDDEDNKWLRRVVYELFSDGT